MWTSINIDAYLAVTSYSVRDTSPSSVLLGVQVSQHSNTAENKARVKASLIAEWRIQNKVTC